MKTIFHSILMLFLCLYLFVYTNSASADDLIEALDLHLENLPDENTMSNNNSRSQIVESSQNQSKFQGQTKLDKELIGIEKKINVLRNSIAETSTNLEQLKQALIHRAGTNNFIQINLKFENHESSGVQSITAKLDNVSIFDSFEQNNLWIPEAEIPIFYGPLTSGEHQLDLQVRIASLRDDSINSKDHIFDEIQQRFSLDIPEGQISQIWEIEIDPATSSATFVNKGTP